MQWPLGLHVPARPLARAAPTPQGAAGAGRSSGSEPGVCSPAVRRLPSALTRSLVGFGKPESRELGRHQEVLAEGPEAPGGPG